MQMRGSTNKSPIKLSMQRKINNMVIFLWMGKTNTEKTPPGDSTIITNPCHSRNSTIITTSGYK